LHNFLLAVNDLDRLESLLFADDIRLGAEGDNRFNYTTVVP